MGLFTTRQLLGYTEQKVKFRALFLELFFRRTVNFHTEEVMLDKLGSVQLTAGGYIRPPRADEAVSVRFKAPGLLHIVGRNGGRKLKKIWQELGVPPWLRDTTPLLFYGETLIAAAGVFVTQEGVAVGENGVSFVWQKTLSQVKAG